MGRWGFLSLLFGLFGAGLGAQTFVVEVQQDGRRWEETSRVQVIDRDGGQEVRGQDKDGTSVVYKWKDGEAWELQVQRKWGWARLSRAGSGLKYQGVWNGQEKQGFVDLKGLPWFGNMDQAFRRFVATGKRQWVVAVVAAKEAWTLRELELNREAEDTIQGQKVIRIKINPPGALSAFWSARYWVTPEGDFFRFEGDQGPGTPFQKIQLLRKTP